MPYKFEVHYPEPENADREARIAAVVAEGGGEFKTRDVSPRPKAAIRLIYAFAKREQAEAALQKVRDLAEYVEGPYLSGD